MTTKITVVFDGQTYQVRRESATRIVVLDNYIDEAAALRRAAEYRASE